MSYMVTSIVTHAGLYLNSNTAISIKEGTVQINITLYLSDVPTTAQDLAIYFDNLTEAIKAVLNLSEEWHIKVLEEESPSMERRLGLSSNAVVNIVFTSSFAGPSGASALQSMLGDQLFVAKLNSKGFKASREKPNLVIAGSQESQPLMIGVYSAVGVLTGLTLLFYLVYHFYGRASHAKSDTDIQCGTVLCDKLFISSVDSSECALDLDAVGASETNTPKEGPFSSDNTMTQMVSDPFLVRRHGTDQMDNSDYSKELDNVLVLIAGLNISIESFVVPRMRREMEATIECMEEISSHDRAAALQLISRVELDDNQSLCSPERKKILQMRISQGPLTEVHFLVLKLMCESEVHIRLMTLNQEKAFNSSEVSNIQLTRNMSRGDSDFDKVIFDQSLLNVFLLLKKCDLEPSYLLQKESRKVIEDNLMNRQGPLLAEHMAVLQLISKAEIDSGLSMDSTRRQLLEKRIKEGPLDADHICAAQALIKVEYGELCSMAQMACIMGPTGHSKTQMQEHDSQLCTADLLQSEKQKEGSRFNNDSVSNQFSSGGGALSQEITAPFFVDMITGLEVRSSLLSRGEKSALQLLELRAKTASIRQSLPEWVLNGLMPPRQGPSPPEQLPAAVFAEHMAQRVGRHTSREAVQISCAVRADIGFLGDFIQPAEPFKLQQEDLESLFFGVEQCSEIRTDFDENQASLGCQEVQPAGQGLNLRMPDAPQSVFEPLVALLSSALTKCFACCLCRVLGAFGRR